MLEEIVQFIGVLILQDVVEITINIWIKLNDVLLVTFESNLKRTCL